MKNSTLLKGEKVYILETIDQHGANEIHEIEAFNLKQAKRTKSQIIGNSRSGQKAVGNLRLKK
jgi:hypothetical protein